MKILIIRPAALGDTLMLAPALFESRKWGEVIVAGRKPGIDFLNPLVSRCLDFESTGWHTLFMEAPEHGVALPAQDAERVIAFLQDPQGVVRNNLERFFPGACIAVLPGYPGKDKAVHVAAYLAKALEISGLPVDSENAMNEAMQRPLLLSARRHRVRTVLHPGSGGAPKNFPPEFWLDLVRVFPEKIPALTHSPTVLLGPAEEKLLPLFSQERRVNVLFCPDKDRLSLLLREAVLYVGQDSGVTHLAAMLGAPTIALFKHSSVAQWRPLGPRVTVIDSVTGVPELVEETLKEARAFLNADTRL